MDNTVTSKPLIVKPGFQQRIVICGSMSCYGDMLAIQEQLIQAGVPSIVPEAEDEYVEALSDEAFALFKREVSFRHLRKIRDPQTIAILAINKDKGGIRDYIGPNTFAEIAVAFVQSKRIFLLQGVPEVYADELLAWAVIPLDGSLGRIADYYKREIQASLRQLSLFEDF